MNVCYVPTAMHATAVLAKRYPNANATVGFKGMLMAWNITEIDAITLGAHRLEVHVLFHTFLSECNEPDRMYFPQV